MLTPLRMYIQLNTNTYKMVQFAVGPLMTFVVHLQLLSYYDYDGAA